MKRLGYYAKSKATGHLYQFEWTQDDKLLINNVEVDPSRYEILEIGFFTADGYNDDPNLTMHIDDDEWEKEMGR